MKVLLASSSSGSRGGGELYLLYLGRALADRGHDVTLWGSSHPRMDELAQSFSKVGPVLRSGYRNTYDRRGRSLTSYFDLATANVVSREWRRAGPDVIHVNKQNLEDGLDLLRAAEWCGIPSLATIHLTQSARYLRARLAPVRDLVSRRALRHYKGSLVSVLEHRRRDLIDFIGPTTRARLVPNGVPLVDLSQRAAMRSAKRSELGLAPDHLLFVAVGRMVAQKRPLRFLAHAMEILREVPDAKFLWIGDGALTGEWDAQAASANLTHAVRRLPWTNDVASFLCAADLFLHVAEFEGLPLALLEAMSSALPCAITENLFAEMPFLNSENAIAVREDRLWLNSLRDRARLAQIGGAARRLVEDEFSFHKMALRYEALYEEARSARS